MEGLAEHIDTITDFVERAHWILPALGLIFIFLCIVSRGFRNFVLGLIILAILVFEGFWFYNHFYSTEEERAEFRRKVKVIFESKESEEKPVPTALPAPENRKL